MKSVQFLGPNHCYFFADGKIVFQSYETVVCTVEVDDIDKITITKGQPQSKTTAKYLNKFLWLHCGVMDYKNLPK